jgi:nucleoside-diphosphate-sugar epimerase
VRNTGDNYVSFTHVDNIAHGLLCGAHALKPGAKACGKFYVVTDGSAHRLWSVIDSAVEKVGMPSLESKLHLPTTLLYDPRTDCPCCAPPQRRYAMLHHAHCCPLFCTSLTQLRLACSALLCAALILSERAAYWC